MVSPEGGGGRGAWSAVAVAVRAVGCGLLGRDEHVDVQLACGRWSGKDGRWLGDVVRRYG